MAIPPETKAQILRLYHAEKWRSGTIARQISVHHSTVRRVLAQAGLPAIASQRAAQIDPYLPFIVQTLEKYPTLTASRLHGMVRERGYRGGVDYFRRVVARHRPRRPVEAYLRLRTLPGEQCQCDWATFPHLTIGRARRPLMAFVMVLSWSRRIFLRFFLNARMENFLRGHAGAFEAFGGCSRVVEYDNLKSAVLERQGQAIHFNPTLLALAGHYRYEPRPVAVARGNEYGVVKNMSRLCSIDPALPLKLTFLRRHNFRSILIFHGSPMGEYHVRDSLYAAACSCSPQSGSLPGIEEALPPALSGTGLSAHVDPEDRLDPAGFFKEHGSVPAGANNARGNRICG